MQWDFEEALDYYKGQGAPSDQSSLINLLKEVQKETGITMEKVRRAADYYGIKENFLLAIIRRIPSLRLEDRHCLEVCCGPNCPKRADLQSFVEKTYGKGSANLEIRYVGCMRMCGKGPNIKWDGQIHHGADEALIRSLIEQK